MSRRNTIAAVLIGAASLFANPLLASPSQPELRNFDQWVTSAMAHWKVPGVAVAAIKNGQVILLKGYGLRNVERRLPVTPRTLMAIGSSSKSFTAMVLGTLVDEGKLDWDQPVRNYLPDFQLYDEVATRLMTARDLVTHRSGLPGHQALWYGRSFTREELYQRLRFIEPNVTFRQRWQYQNLMFMTAGVLAGRISGQTWEELVRRRIFEPLGMMRSNFSVVDMQRTDDYSLPYAEVGAEIEAIAFRNLDAVGPAGSINSSVEEMIHYVQLNIDQGTYQGRRLITAATATQMQSPQSALQLNTSLPDYPELGQASYGLGLMVTSYRGKKLVSHGGGIDGFRSAMSWLPNDKIGVVVLTNSGGSNPLPTLIERNLFDRLLGLTLVDWIGRIKEEERRADEHRKEMEKQSAPRVSGTSPSHPIAAYAGQYQHQAYGVVTVHEQSGRLVLTIDGLTVPLEHFHYDVFKTVPASVGALPLGFAGDLRVSFSSGSDGIIEGLQANLEPALPDIVFKRNRQ